jgi:MYXO-CTERM domain-containing protein
MARSLLASLLLALLLTAPTARAQRCVSPTDRADIPLDNRYCGAELIDLGLGPAGFGLASGPADGCLHLNDDQSGPRIDITPFFPGGLRFFSMTHNSLFVNTNGNITFSDALGTFTPDAFPVAARPMIAPFWADVDTRASSGGCTATTAGTCVPNAEDQVWWHFEPGRAYITWDEVSYFNCQRDRRNSFQLILSAVEGCGGFTGGDFDVEFRYNRCEWDTGDASGGTGGFLTSTFGGAAAQAGFDAGDSVNFVEIMNSRVTRTINRTLCEDSNVGIPGVWRFQIRGGSVICPDAGDACTVPGAMGACAEGRTNCVGSGTECVQQIEPRAEICDNIDNDCNGVVDDGSDSELCFDISQSCVNGVCVDNCFEGACNAGLTCSGDGVCVDPACAGVTCAEGERCEAGACIPACEGIVCPEPTSCVAGRCVDVCAGLTCDDCTACEAGSCVPRCTSDSCGAGEECAPDGRCISAGCTGVTCSAGTVCRAGACVDACLDAICPPGDVCTGGTCVRRERPDAGPLPDVPRQDAGGPIEVDGGEGMDAGGRDAGADAGRRPSGSSGGCGCRASAGSSSAGALLALVALALGLRRR